MQVVTTIYESHTQVVTATEIKTSSIHLTPSPTWEVQTVTITPTVAPAPLPQQNFLKTASIPQPFILPQLQPQVQPQQPKKRNNKLEAQVVEIDQSTSNRDDLRSAYGAFFASSAQRSAARFGDILRPVRNPDPLFSSQDYDYYEDFDQQFLAAQNKPVYVQSPPQKSKVFTLYFSGTKPGSFTTKLTRLAVDDNGQPILSRNKRSNISPSKVLPIENTLPPSFNNELDSSENENIFTVVPENLLDSSMTVVTVTQTVTVTDPLVACSV